MVVPTQLAIATRRIPAPAGVAPCALFIHSPVRQQGRQQRSALGHVHLNVLLLQRVPHLRRGSVDRAVLAGGRRIRLRRRDRPGIGYTCQVSTLIKWFPDRPGLATGIAMALLIHGVGYLAFMSVGWLLIRVPADGWKPAGWEPTVESAGSLISEGHVSARNAIRMLQFWRASHAGSKFSYLENSRSHGGLCRRAGVQCCLPPGALRPGRRHR
jgi:hypothetical protein